MACRTICISRARGAYGEEIGRLVADKLGFRYVDEEIVAQAAARENVEPEAVADVERRRSLMERLLSGLAASGADAYVAPLPAELTVDGERYRELIREAIVETASQGQVVIVSHAASYALNGPEVLRAFVVASPEVRAQRLGEAEGLDADEAKKLVRRSDGNRADYLKRFYDVEHELPHHYDVVVNTDVLTAEQAAAVIVQAATG